MIKEWVEELLDRVTKTPIVKGECVQCGACCKGLFLTYHRRVVTSLNEYNKLLKSDQETYHRFKATNNGESGGPIPFDCIYQDESGLCSEHETRPQICRTYPHSSIFRLGAELEDGCGYRVVERDSFEYILDKKCKRSKPKK